MDWYRRAAGAGDPKAMLSLSFCLESGFGVATDKKAAGEWLQRAAESGNPEAYYRLALAYSEGGTLPRNQELATRYLNLAAEQKLQPAVSLLSEQTRAAEASKTQAPATEPTP